MPLTPARQLVYRFLSLPHVHRVSAAAAIGHPFPEDWHGSMPPEGWFKGVADAGLLSSLWDAVEARRAEGMAPAENPWKVAEASQQERSD